MSWLRRRLRGWRTVAFGLAVAVLGLLEAMQAVDLGPLLKDYAGQFTAVVGLITVFLRVITTTAVGVEKPAEIEWEDGEPRA
jgi:hypothetical protein